MFRHPVFALSIRIVLLAGLSVAVALRLEELGMGSAFPEVHLAGMAAVIALAPLNLSAEAMKWKTLMRNDAFGYRRALAGVLNGMCTGFFTPNRVGEVVGRWRTAPLALKHEAVATSAMGSALQGAVTVCIGLAGVFFYPYASIFSEVEFGSFLPNSKGIPLLLMLVLVGLCVGGILLFPRIRRNAGKLKRAFLQVEPGAIIRGWFWAAGRYLVFSLQLAIALYAFGITGSPLEICAGIGVVYLIQSYFPGALLAEMGVREVVAAVVFAPFFENPLHAVPAVFFIWMVNVVVPIAYTAAIRPKWIRAFGSN